MAVVSGRCQDTPDFFEEPAPKRMTSSERQRAYITRQRAAGRIQRSMWATPEEWAELSAQLKAMRGEP